MHICCQCNLNTIEHACPVPEGWSILALSAVAAAIAAGTVCVATELVLPTGDGGICICALDCMVVESLHCGWAQAQRSSPCLRSSHFLSVAT